MSILSGKSVVNIGGTGGLGFEFSKQLLLTGVEKIAVFDIADPRETVKQLKVLFPQIKILFEKIDVKDKSSIETAFKKVVDEFGSIDIVINGAGIVNEKNYEHTVGVNLLGVINGTYTALDHIALENGGKGGIICNVSSLLGLDSLCCVPTYSATKHAINGFTAALSDKRLESKYGVKFITFCPGFTETSMISNLGPMLLSEDLLPITKECVKANGLQSAEACGKAFLKGIIDSVNGSVFLLNRSECTTVKLQKYLNRTSS